MEVSTQRKMSRSFIRYSGRIYFLIFGLQLTRVGSVEMKNQFSMERQGAAKSHGGKQSMSQQYTVLLIIIGTYEVQVHSVESFETINYVECFFFYREPVFDVKEQMINKNNGI